MSTAVWISARIDELIREIEKVTVFKDHWSRIGKNLRQLRHTLTEMAMKNLLPIVEIIERLTTYCCDDHSVSQRIAFRELESALLRLHLRLIQHLANLTDDYQTKMNILCDGYHEQQLLGQKIYNETIRQRLEKMDQSDQLSTKNAKTIEFYLRCCMELHKSIPVGGLKSETIGRVAHGYYGLSSGTRSELPIMRSFFELKTDQSTLFERSESQRLLIGSEVNLFQNSYNKKQMMQEDLYQQLVSTPYMLSMVERDRYGQDEEESASKVNILRTKRWIVILGDPGSGKTSFARWIVRQLASNGQDSSNFGPYRIPILICVKEFTEVLSQHPSLTLFDYIGQHTWMGKAIIDDQLISPDTLSNALQDYIKLGQALIILDGLDEVQVSNQRSSMINLVENFVETYVQTPAGSSAIDYPSQSGGNQLIVTSRIVGYHVAPLAGHFAHYIIKPMDIEHIKDFIDYWFYNVHQQMIDMLGSSRENQGRNHGEILKHHLEKEENRSLRDLASNACLLSFICSVAFGQSNGSSLPTQRIELYQNMVDSMIDMWTTKGCTLSRSKLIELLSSIAIYIHQNSSSGLIRENKLKEICIQSIKSFGNQELNSDMDNQVTQFIRLSREDVGIFVARGESLYGFLHLTFQEYFTGLRLTNINQEPEESKVHLISQSLHGHAIDPHFQVPIAFALQTISASWSLNEFDELCREFVRSENESKSPLPLGAFMLISCANEFVHYPSYDVLFEALDHLIITAGQQQWSVACPFLFDRIVIALRKFRHNIAPLWINNFLSRSPPHDIQAISALCYLIEGKSVGVENMDWLDQSFCSMLQSFLILENGKNQFVIDRLLVKVSFFNHHLLPVHSNSLKEFLIKEEIELHSIPVFLLPLIITLYGGLKRDHQAIAFDAYHIYRESSAVSKILIRFISKEDRNQSYQNLINIEKHFLNALRAHIESNDQSSETVDLCIAAICLSGIDFVRQNEKILPNVVLNSSMDRFKYISMILRQFYFSDEEKDRFIENEATAFISDVVKRLDLNPSSKRFFLSFLDASKSGVARLRSTITSTLSKGKSTPDQRVTLHLPNLLRKEDSFFIRLLSTDITFDQGQNSCSLLHHFTKLFWILEHDDDVLETQNRMAVAMDTIPEYLLYQNDEDLLFPLTFVPPQLQNLYFRLLEKNCIMIDSIGGIANDKEYLSYGHILVECLMVLSNASCKRLSPLGALVALLPMLRRYRLENFGSSLLWTLPERDSSILQRFETSKQHSLDRVETFSPGFDMTDEERQKLIKESIKQEHMRFRNALIENDGRSMRLYTACISLARICKWAPEARKLQLLEESIRGAMTIESKLVRLDALSVILLYSHSDYHRIAASKDRSLQKEIEYQLNVIFPGLPILLQATMFIRCLPLLQHQATIESCLENLRHKLMHADQQDRLVVNEALSPYFESNSTIVPWKQHLLDDSLTHHNDADYNRTIDRRSAVLRECFTKDPYNHVLNDSLSLPLLLSNLYLVELGSDLHGFIENNDHWLRVPRSDTMIRDESIIIARLFHLRSSTLTVTQASTITHLLSSNVSLNRLKYSKKFWFALNDELHRLNSVEFKACRLLEFWMKWRDSSELSLLAFQAALLLTQSDFWSVEAATLVCDLLSHENDRFRQKAEVILRSRRTRSDRTSSRLDIDVLLILTKKMAHFQHTSPFAKLTLSRMFSDITLDIQSHLETFLWLERYRIHALIANRTILHKLNVSPVSPFVSYFPSDMAINVSFCGHVRNISGDSQQFMCELIESNFSSFLDIGGDVTSKLVLVSHIQFVVSVIVSLATLSAHDDSSRSLRLNALVACIEESKNLAICQAAAYAVGYMLDQETYKILFKKLQIIVKKAVNETSPHSDPLISALIASYCHFIAVSGIDFDQDDIDLFRQLLKYSSSIILKAVHVGLARVLKKKSMLIEMLDSDHIQCFHALIGSTAYFFKYEVQERCAKNTAEFVQENPALLSIFVAELYNSIRHFTKGVVYRETTENILAYGYPQYVEVASLIAVQMPAAFISCIKECGYEDELKRSLFYTSKQHDFPRRGACLTILSVFGELTMELCEMFIEGLCHDLHMQKICNTCLTRINTISGQNAVLNLLFSYLKSKSMIVRYAAAKMLLRFSLSSLISFDQVRLALDELLSDPTSEEELWLIDEHEDLLTDSLYYCVGSLKDVIYCLLVQRLTGDTSRVVQRDELNNIDLDFVQSEKASRLASCLYEETRETGSRRSPPSHYKSDHDKKTWVHEESTCNDHVDERMIANDEMEEKTIDEGAQSPIIGVDIYPSQSPSRKSITEKKPSTLCVLI